MNIYQLSRPALTVFCFAATPIYVWLAFFGHVPYIYTSVLLLTALVAYAAFSRLFSHNGHQPTFSFPLNKSTALSCIALLLITTWVLVNYAAGDRVDAAGRSLFATNLGLLANYVAWLGIGIAIGNGLQQNESSIRPSFTLCWVILTAYFATQIDSTTGSISFASEASDKKSMYLLFADFYAVASLFLIGLTRSSKYRILIIGISVTLLFVLQSRASLFFFIFSIAAFNILSRSVRSKMLLIAAMLVALFYLPTIDLSKFESASRMTVFFERGLQGDSSFVGRIQLLRDGVSAIAANPVFGAYNSPVDQRNNVTAYIHNILSYWQVYGIFVFFIMTYLLVVAPSAFINRYLISKKQKDMTAYTKAACLMSIFVLIQVISARAYVWHFSWLLIGLMATSPRLSREHLMAADITNK